MKQKYLQKPKTVWDYQLDSFLTIKIDPDFFKSDLKILNDSKFEFTDHELDRFLFEIKAYAFDVMHDQIERARNREYNRISSHEDTRFQSARMRVIRGYIETNNLFSKFFSFYLDENFKSDQPTIHKQLTVELLEKMILKIEYINSSSFIKSLVEMISRLEMQGIQIEIKDIIKIQESKSFNDLMLISLDMDLPPDSANLFPAFIRGFSKDKVENMINNMSPNDRFHYSQAMKLDNKLEFETKRSLNSLSNKKVICFLEKMFFFNKRSF